MSYFAVDKNTQHFKFQIQASASSDNSFIRNLSGFNRSRWIGPRSKYMSRSEKWWIWKFSIGKFGPSLIQRLLKALPVWTLCFRFFPPQILPRWPCSDWYFLFEDFCRRLPPRRTRGVVKSQTFDHGSWTHNSAK